MRKIKAAIISLGSVSSKWTYEAMKKYFDIVDFINIKDIEIRLGLKQSILYKGKSLEEYDCIYIKGSYRYSPVLRSIASLLPEKTFTPINADAFTIGHDKLITHQKLQVADIPMPITYIAPTTDSAKMLLKNADYPILFKFPQGTQGKGVMYAESFASANSMLDALTAMKQPFLIQEYIETGGSDIRAFVIGDKVVASMMRTAQEGDKRSNLHSGGKGHAIKLDQLTEAVAIKTAKTIGCGICGVDILLGSMGPKVIELNLSPSLQGITAATKVDIADKIAKYLFEKTKEIVEKDTNSQTKEVLKNHGISNLESKDIISKLDFRGNRILLPEIISKISKFNDSEEYVIKVDKDKINIKKM
ncbi:MAG: ATP-grasp domain-containing protein [Candidatus Woesearchaeota archaeon]